MAPAAGFRSRGAPHAHALQHDLPWRLSCHCETPTLGCLCQQRPCALSLSALFMGTREVARRVAGSGRAFLQHCSLYPAFKTARRGCSESWLPGRLYYLEGAVCSAKLSKHTARICQNVSRRNVHISTALTEMNVFRSDAGPWSYSLPAARTINSCSGSPPPPPGPAGSSPRLRPSPSPRTPPRTAGASSPSTSPSSPGAKLLTWLPSAAPQTAMQACTRPCPHSARPPWTSTNCTCPAPSPARSRTRARATRRTRQKTAPRPNKVGSTGASSPPSANSPDKPPDASNQPCHFITTQISRCGRRATTTRTRAMRANQRLRPPSRRPPRKTSNAKTLQVHCVPDTRVRTHGAAVRHL